MPLNPEGEHLEGLGRGNVAKIEKWSDWSFFQFALTRATEAFEKAGALQPIEIASEDILIMEYYSAKKLVFVIQRRIAGKERYHVETIDLSPAIIAELVATDKWMVVH